MAAIAAAAIGNFVPGGLHARHGLPEMLQIPQMQIARKVAHVENVAVATA
ncbi:MAG: hypothetical protein JNM70_03065 [Anaerolineae bacterium]|nr:hypothetical protein [Anaerolineae bacterium]